MDFWLRMLLRLVLRVEGVPRGPLAVLFVLNVRDVWLHFWLIAYTQLLVFYIW